MAIFDPTPLQFLRTLVQEIDIVGPLDPTPPQYRNREKIMKKARMLEKADKVAVLEKNTEHEPLEQLEEIQLSVEEKSLNILQENVRRYNSRLAAGLEPSSEDEEEMSEQELLHRLQEYATIYNYHTPIARQPSYMSEEDIMLDLCEPVYELVPGVDVDAFMEKFFSGTSDTKGAELFEGEDYDRVSEGRTTEKVAVSEKAGGEDSKTDYSESAFELVGTDLEASVKNGPLKNADYAEVDVYFYQPKKKKSKLFALDSGSK